MRITICGGGSLGHVCMGVLSQSGNEINVLTNHPEQWSDSVLVEDCHGKIYEGRLHQVSDNPFDLIPDSDMVLLCLPGFLIEETLRKILPCLKPNTVVGSIVCSTGFFFFAHEILSKNQKLFGFQRVPFIARVFEYGKKAKLLGYKKELAIAVENMTDAVAFKEEIEGLFLTPAKFLNSFYEASLTNSNPILHTGRLYGLWRDWQNETYPECILFYHEWDDYSAQLLIDMDEEFMQLLDKLGVPKGQIPGLLDYYESTDAASLAEKLRSIPAFQTIKAPMKETEKGWIPDFSSRYFTEDFPFGLKFIRDLAHIHQIETPNIDMVYDWGMSIMNKESI